MKCSSKQFPVKCCVRSVSVVHYVQDCWHTVHMYSESVFVFGDYEITKDESVCKVKLEISTNFPVKRFGD